MRRTDPNLARILAEERERSTTTVGYVRLFGTGAWLVLTILFGQVDGDLGLRTLDAQRPAVALYFAVALGAVLAGRWSPAFRGVRHWMVALVDVPFIYWAQFTGLGIDQSHPMVAATLASYTMAISLLIILPAPAGTRAGPNIAGAAVAAAIAIGFVFSRPEYPRVWTLNTAIVFSFAALIAFVIARRPERVARKFAEEQKLRRYFTPAVAERIVSTDVAKGETRDVTVLFTDVRGFTNLSETLDAEKVVATLNEWFAAAVPVVFKHGGTLDKFLGDGLMAYFGAPVPQSDHAARAVACALDLLSALEGVNAARAARGGSPLAIGIGVHGGPAVVGEIGAPDRLEFTVVGDTVNTASRLEGLTKDLAVPVVVSGVTREAAGDAFGWEALGTVPVRGRAQPVAVFAPSARRAA